MSVLPRTKPITSLSLSKKRLPLGMRRYFLPVRRVDVKSPWLEPDHCLWDCLRPDSNNYNKFAVIPHTFSIYQTICIGGSFNSLGLVLYISEIMPYSPLSILLNIFFK